MIIVIVGPTAVGKTKMSIELAKKYDGEIINADSTQFYKELNVATAKVTDEEAEGIVHHLIDIKEVNDEYTIYDFQIEGRQIIEEIKSKNKTPIIVGGSGLYISALMYDYQFVKEDKSLNIDLSNDEIYNELINKGIQIDKNNRQRLLRAYQKYIINDNEVEEETAHDRLIYEEAVFIGLTTDRDILYNRINKRVDVMVENGLLEEASNIIDKYKDAKEIRTVIGYKELIPYFNNEISLDEALDKIRQNSRRYAKRQYTWFNNKMAINWFDVDFDNFDNTIKEVVHFIEKIKQ